MRAEKQYLLDEIKDEMEGSEMIMVMSYQNLDANQTAGFRDEVFKAGGSTLVVKKRVFLKALEGTDIELSKDDLGGHIGIVISKEHPVATTKSIFNFIKEHKNSIGVLGGQFQGKGCTDIDFEKISKLPSIDEMRAQLIGTFEAPMSQTVSVMNALLTSVLHCLDNKAAEGESA
ncbi:MAG: 50S ribosomal protein L10 [Chlamydiia bacterium]|nr:50S ribosomal protein L10 [Chlamydiia bacterium]